MKKVFFLTLVVGALANGDCLAGSMPVILNCSFVVQGEMIYISVFNHLEWERSFNLNDNEVTIVKGVDGDFAVSVHRKGNKFWEVSEMYDASARQAAVLAPLVGAKIVNQGGD